MRKTDKERALLIACLILLLYPLAAWGAGAAAPDPVASSPGLLDRPTTRPHDSPTISNVRVTNVGDKSFSVSWTTDVPASGQINYGATPALGSSQNDDPGVSPYTHHVTLGGLSPDTTYYFDVVSDGALDDNGGVHYSVTTGPALAIPGTDIIFGRVFQSDEVTPAQGAVVYVTLIDRDGTGSSGSSAVLSALVEGAGYWNVNLASARTADHGAYFTYSAAGGDDLHLEAQGGPLGLAELTVDVGQSNDANGYPVALPDLILRLTGLASLQLAAGWNLISFDAWPISGTQVITDVRTILLPIEGHYIRVLGFDPARGGLTYDPALPKFSTLKSLDPLHGYWIKATDNVTLTITGQEVPITTPLSLATGWNLVSYLPDVSLPVTVALDSINGLYSRVLGFDPVRGGLTYDPTLPQFSTLKNLDPLRGYWIKMTTPGTLVYPSGGLLGMPAPIKGAKESYPAAVPVQVCGAGVHLYTEWVSFYSEHTTLDGAPVPVGACIEAWVGALKIGYYVVDIAGSYGFLAAYRDDPTTPEKDGAEPGDPITFTTNGHPVAVVGDFGGIAEPVWTSHGEVIRVGLAGVASPAPTGPRLKLYLPLIRREVP